MEMHPFIKQTLYFMDTELARIHTSLSRLSDDDVWKKPRYSMNSVGNLCLHLAGNEYQNIVSGIGKNPFIRTRSAEFLANGNFSIQELSEKLTTTREQSRAILQMLTEEDFATIVNIHYPFDQAMKSYEKPLLDLVYHTATHYSYHTGQIVLLTKFFQNGEEHVLQWRH